MRSYGNLKSQDVEKNSIFCVFWKNDPLRENFQNSVPKGFIATPIDMLCSNFVKFGQREIAKVVRYLPDKKFAWLSCSSRYCADRAQHLPGPASDSVLRVLQISSKSVHFRRCYSRTREHRHSALESESNLRLKPSVEPNNCKQTTITVITFRNVFRRQGPSTPTLNEPQDDYTEQRQMTPVAIKPFSCYRITNAKILL